MLRGVSGRGPDRGRAGHGGGLQVAHPQCPANRPSPLFVHADYRSGNFLFDEVKGEITAWLDWKVRCWATGISDLTYAALPIFQHYAEDGVDDPGFGDDARGRSSTADYEKASGLPRVDPARIRYLRRAFNALSRRGACCWQPRPGRHVAHEPIRTCCSTMSARNGHPRTLRSAWLFPECDGMNQDFGNPVASGPARAGRGSYFWLLGNADKHVTEQLHLSLAAIGFMQQRVPLARSYYRGTLQRYLDHGGTRSRRCSTVTRRASQTNRSRAKRCWRIRPPRMLICAPRPHRCGGDYVAGREQSGHAARNALDALVMEHSEAILSEDRSWRHTAGLSSYAPRTCPSLTGNGEERREPDAMLGKVLYRVRERDRARRGPPHHRASQFAARSASSRSNGHRKRCPA